MASKWDWAKPDTSRLPGPIVPRTPDVSDYDQDRIARSVSKWTLGPNVKVLEKMHGGVLPVKVLRDRLKEDPGRLLQPIEITISGTLFTCALLTSGWWDRPPDQQIDVARMAGFQRWWFHGFDHWAPSWNISWRNVSGTLLDHVITQIGYEDEADSLPLLIPGERTSDVANMLDPRWGGMEAEARGWLGHWSHYKGIHNRAQVIQQFEGLLDYCIWIDTDAWKKGEHFVRPLKEAESVLRTDTYSGYLWRCVSPKAAMPRRQDGTPTPEMISLNNVYFLWDHTNFADEKAVECSLKQLEKKEEFLRSMGVDDLVLIQKSSDLVGGAPLLTGHTQFFKLLNPD
jgi:hypothetical protein